ncbi:MAG: hypothetical protein RML46_11245 [Anaerolineae bacterium]|nr:hypothetical protein [Anaerolineae bacterium]
MQEDMVLETHEELQSYLHRTADEMVEEVIASLSREDKAAARTVLWMVALNLKDPDRFQHEIEHGAIAEAFGERKGIGRLIACVNLARAGAEILLSEDMEVWALFVEALHIRPSSGLDRSAAIRNAVMAWRYADRSRGPEEALARREELMALLHMWKEMSHMQFRAATARRPRAQQEAETQVQLQPLRATYQIYPLHPDGTRDDSPVEVQIMWHRPEHEQLVRRLLALLEEFAMGLGEVHLV